MAKKVPIPGTEASLSSQKSLTGNLWTFAGVIIGFFVLFVGLAGGAWLFNSAEDATGANADTQIPVV